MIVNSLTTALDSLKNVIEALDQVENAESINDDQILALAPRLDGAMENLKEHVDSRINFIEYCGLMETKIKADIDYLNKKVKILQNVQASLKKHTMFILENNPTISFEGERKKFKIYNNGGKQPIEFKSALQEYKNIIDPNDLTKFPSDMIEERKIFVLNKEKFEGFLSAGGTCEGAKALPRGKHLRIV